MAGAPGQLTDLDSRQMRGNDATPVHQTIGGRKGGGNTVGTISSDLALPDDCCMTVGLVVNPVSDIPVVHSEQQS